MKTEKQAAIDILKRRDKYVKTKKIITASVFSAVAVFVCCVCVVYFTNPPKKPVENDRYVYFPSAQHNNLTIDADIFNPATNLKELYNKSYAVVVGYVVGTNQTNYNESTDILLSTVSIEKVIKGNLKEKEQITIEETGTSQDQGDISICGVPLLKENMKVLLFLTEPSDVVSGGNAYGICDVFLGKAFYDQNGTIYPASMFAKNNAIILTDFFEPTTQQALLQLLDVR